MAKRSSVIGAKQVKPSSILVLSRFSTLSQQVALSPDKGIAGLDYLGKILISGSSQGLGLAMVFFSIGSIFNNVLFYKSKAIPFFLAILGLVGAVLITTGTVLSIVIDLPSAIVLGTGLPIILFEYILGFYLIFFGMKYSSQTGRSN